MFGAGRNNHAPIKGGVVLCVSIRFVGAHHDAPETRFESHGQRAIRESPLQFRDSP